jgi:hypothetical protein
MDFVLAIVPGYEFWWFSEGETVMITIRVSWDMI